MGERAEGKKQEGYYEKNHMAVCMQVHGLWFLRMFSYQEHIT